jgi:hypothetical protein
MIRALLAWLDRRIDGRIVARGYERFERERQALPPGTPMRAYYDEVARIGAEARARDAAKAAAEGRR